MLEKEGDKIYIKKYRKNKFITYFFIIVSIIIMVILCISIFTYDFNKGISLGNIVLKIDFGLFHSLLQNNFTKIILSICVISFIGIFIMNNLFYGDCDYYINIVTRKIHYLDGNWKFRKEIILEFEKIKSIILIENMEMQEGGKSYSYQIDIYDNELNAYKINVFSDYDMANKIAKKIGEIMGKEVIDWTHIENYEGYIKRII
jgi:hypothetical protein